MTPRLTRRRFLASTVGLAAGATAFEGLWREPRQLTISHHDLGAPGTGSRPLRIVQLTDLHLKRVGAFERRVADNVRRLEPDLIAITGDAVDDEAGAPLLHDFLALLPPTPHRIATLGNWEHWSGIGLTELDRIYDGSGFRLLVNEAINLKHLGHELTVVGLDDLLAGEPDPGRALATAADTRGPLWISHCPQYRDELVRRSLPGVAAISGHTHGGQVRIGRWAPVLPRGSGGYVSGWYRGGGLDLYVSRGLGTSMIPVRLGCQPEMCCFDWHPEAA